MPYNTFKRWPGKADGDPAPRICHAVTTQLLKDMCGVLDVPGYLIEVRNHWWILAESTQRALRAIRNACRFFKMRNDPFEVEPKQFAIADKTRPISLMKTRMRSPKRATCWLYSSSFG